MAPKVSIIPRLPYESKWTRPCHILYSLSFFAGVHIDTIKIKEGKEEQELKNYEIKGSFSKLYAWQLNEPALTPATEPFAKSLNDWINVSSIVSYTTIKTSSIQIISQSLFYPTICPSRSTQISSSVASRGPRSL